MHAKIYDRTGQPVVFGLWINPQTNGFHEFVTENAIQIQKQVESSLSEKPHTWYEYCEDSANREGDMLKMVEMAAKTRSN